MSSEQAPDRARREPLHKLRPDQARGRSTTPTAERWRELDRVVDAALDVPREARAVVVEHACAGDDALRNDAERFLDACERAESGGDVLAGSAGEFVAPVVADLAARTDALDAVLPEVLATALGGRYTVERELGRGGMATVYLGYDERLRRHVAIKILRPSLAAELGAVRFLHEIEIAAQLQHQHIVPLHDADEAAGLPYFVMPYIEGESLRERLTREGPLAVPSVLAIANDVAEALDYAHHHHVVHRDVKPANILLAATGALVADFGVAQALTDAGGERLTAKGVAVGTPQYMSPEQAAGEDHVDGRSDVYALACVVYEMLAGEPPFSGTRQAVLSKHLQAPPPDVRVVRPTLSAGTQQVLANALAKVPADRFATAGEFVRALQSSIASAPTRTTHGPRVTAAAALALTLVLTAGTLWSFVERGPKPRPSHPMRESPRSDASVGSTLDTSRYAIIPSLPSREVSPNLNETHLLRDAITRWRGISVVDGFQVRDALARRGGAPITSRAARTMAMELGAGRYFPQRRFTSRRLDPSLRRSL
jgi:serine/threonine protein kinase